MNNFSSINQRKKNSNPILIGIKIAENYRNKWIYSDELGSWLVYAYKQKGVWSIVSKEYMASEIDNILESQNISGYGTNSYIFNILKTLERELYLRNWNKEKATEYLPFRNGVLELAINKLHDHNPEFRFLWQLPRKYNEKQTSWNNLEQWLTTATKGSAKDKELLITFAASLMQGQDFLCQKFLHLLTKDRNELVFVKLMVNLIGEENTATFNNSDLENKHKRVDIFGKRLVIIDNRFYSNKTFKTICNFKKLVGRELLYSRQRRKSDEINFVFTGLTIFVSNLPYNKSPGFPCYRSEIVCLNRNLPFEQQNQLKEKDSPELIGFTNYLLKYQL